MRVPASTSRTDTPSTAGSRPSSSARWLVACAADPLCAPAGPAPASSSTATSASSAVERVMTRQSRPQHRVRTAPTYRRRVLRPLVGLAVAVLALVALASPAAAHAALESTEPAAGAILEAPPDAVTLHFTEAVQADDDSVR